MGRGVDDDDLDVEGDGGTIEYKIGGIWGELVLGD
jgi:hypothetical protein